MIQPVDIVVVTTGQGHFARAAGFPWLIGHGKDDDEAIEDLLFQHDLVEYLLRRVQH